MDYLKSSLAAPGVVLIELNRPEKRNALNNATLKELADHLQQLDVDSSVKAVVITGNPQCFAAGADLNELAQLDVVSIQQDQRPLLWKGIDEFSKPLIMARSEEHTSELQSRPHLVCRLLLEKKK